MEPKPAISVKDLWQVFGDQPSRAFKEARKASDKPGRIAAHLENAGHVAAVRGVSFDVRPGELFVIMGLSGSGKSTLIRGISRLVEPTSGQVHLDGEDILAASKSRLIEIRRSKIGMVFQHFGLFPHMRVIDNVAFPLKVGKIRREERHAQVRPILNMVGLEGREDAFPRELSGGQRQRVGIARSLATQCTHWFLDEPFSALDPLIRRQLQDEFLQIRAQTNTTIVFITHDITEALKLADRIAIMRDGEIVQIGSPTEIVLNPVNDYVREFSHDVARGKHALVGSIMDPTISGNAPGSSSVELSPDMPLEDAMRAFIRPSDVASVRSENGEIVGSITADAMIRALQPNRP